MYELNVFKMLILSLGKYIALLMRSFLPSTIFDMEMEREDRFFLASVLSPGRYHRVSTWLLAPWFYRMLHYLFMTYDFSGVICAYERTGGGAGNGDARGVHPSQNGKPE